MRDGFSLGLLRQLVVKWQHMDVAAGVGTTAITRDQTQQIIESSQPLLFRFSKRNESARIRGRQLLYMASHIALLPLNVPPPSKQHKLDCKIREVHCKAANPHLMLILDMPPG